MSSSAWDRSRKVCYIKQLLSSGACMFGTEDLSNGTQFQLSAHPLIDPLPLSLFAATSTTQLLVPQPLLFGLDGQSNSNDFLELLLLSCYRQNTHVRIIHGSSLSNSIPGQTSTEYDSSITAAESILMRRIQKSHPSYH